MVVIAIAATMMGIAVGVFGSSADAALKQESTHLLATIRLLYNESVTTRQTYRLVFDLDEQKYWAEAAEAGVTVGAADQAEDSKKKIEKNEEEGSGGEEAAEGGESEAAPEKTAGGFNLVDEEVLKRHSLSKGTKFKDYFVTHAPAGQNEGKAYLYFFPTGLTEKAVIHLTDADEKRDYSLEVRALTGQVRILAEYVEWKEKE